MTTTYNQIHVQTRNCSDAFPFRVDLTADKLSELLGWHPAGEFLREIVDVLKSGKGVQVFTAKYRVQGNAGIAYTFLPVPAGLPVGIVPPIAEIVHYNQRPDDDSAVAAEEGGAL